MRRLPALLLALSLLSAAVLTGAALLIPASGDHVAYTETVLAGDPAAARGLTLHCALEKNTAGDSALRWATTHSFAPALTSRSSFSFTLPHQHPVCYLGLTTLFPQETYHLASAVGEGMPAGLVPAFQQLRRQPPSAPGQIVSRTVRLADYVTHWPLSGTLSRHQGADNLRATQLFIPVPGSLRVTLSLLRTESGQLAETIAHSPDTALSPFLSPTEEGQWKTNLPLAWGADFLCLSVGRGVYRATWREKPNSNYGWENLLLEPAVTLLPPEAGLEIDRLWLTHGDSRLHVLARSPDGVSYLELDPATGEKLRQVLLIDDPEAELQCFPGDGFVAAVTNDTAITLFAPDGDGRWVEALRTAPLSTAVLNAPGIRYLNHWDDEASHTAMAWDGERLAVVSPGQHLPGEPSALLHPGGVDGVYTDCGFELAVYDKTGLLYLGHYDSDLDAQISPYPLRFRLEWQ